MNLQLNIGGNLYRIDTEGALDISIPLDFHAKQLTLFGIEEASATTYEAGSFVADTTKGGSCNIERYSIVPHANGTHTECVGHICSERISVQKVLQEAFVPTTIISLTPQDGKGCAENYHATPEGSDSLILSSSLKEALRNVDKAFLRGLVIRTLPNDESKKIRNYDAEPAAYFSEDAMQFIAEIGVQHLLIDLPSVDQLEDPKMSAHRIFWNLAQGGSTAAEHSARTITELVYVPQAIPDGQYLLNLQIPSFVADAAPSRPLLFKLLEKSP